MRRLILILLLTGCPIAIYGQIVKGRILDASTLDPIALAAVYFNGTFMGTSSDEEGNFELDVTMYASMPLTISAVGYYSYTLSDFTIEGRITIRLTPKVYEIDEVEIRKKTNLKERKANLKQFRNEFLGSTPNGRSCQILNEEAITFLYNSRKDTLRAFALEPIQIHNRALGYNITYYLDEFVCCKEDKTLFFTGNILFTEDLTTLRRFSERKRRYAYRGSRMHFFRALWADDLGSTLFDIQDSVSTVLGYKDVIIQDSLGVKFLSYPGSLEILYSTNWSRINFLEEYIYFAKDGFFDPTAVGWEGNLGKKRLGDFLPYEYNSED